jgi:prevent-host-death family protein
MQTFSATDARIKFGRVMRLAQKAPVLVERGGKPVVVVLSKQEYDRLAGKGPDWREMLAETHRRVAAVQNNLPDAAEMVRLGRETRDEQIADALR